MVYTEHFIKADTTIEIIHNNNDCAIVGFVRNGYTNIYASLTDLMKNEILGENEVEFLVLDMDTCQRNDMSNYGYDFH